MMVKVSEKFNNLPVILDGRKLRDQSVSHLKNIVEKCVVKPTLVIIQVGNLAESSAYIEQKRKFAEKIGAGFVLKQFSEDVEDGELLEEIKKLNQDRGVHGVIVQLPIPTRLDGQRIIDAIAVSKDTDGLTSENKKKFECGDPDSVLPATARGVLSLLKGYGIDVREKKVTVIGRSALVGAPIATLLRREGAKITVCHSKTENVAEKSSSADILIVAIGRPNFINDKYVSKGEVVIDVGINSVDSGVVSSQNILKLEYEIPKRKIVGDVDFESVKNIVGAISPVPGGVGPMTVLSLFENLLEACSKISITK